VTWDEALQVLADIVTIGTPRHVMTPNPEYIMIARSAPEVSDLLDSVDLSLADGVGVKWAGSMLGQPISDVIAGSELVTRMAPGSALRGERWFLLGAAPGVAKEAAARLAADNPGLDIAGTFDGAPDPSLDNELCGRIGAAAPVDVLLVAYGSPAQDLWIARNLPRLRVPVAIGVGGTFNFLAGVSPAPPNVVKRMGLIWLFRLVTEPWRWRRQLSLVKFAYLVLRDALAGP
jgi:N-acetylglucosaminyldiphosphoundecaprenol N-acetyl-beta-D-mannosaminyltransferase